MEIQILIISVITYLLLFNNCLTFRLTILNNAVITAVLVINMVFICDKIGSLFVIPMFIILIAYVIWLKKEDWLWNVFLVIFSYLFMVIIDNLTHLVWSIIGLDLSIHWPVYMIVDYPIFFFSCRFIAKKTINIKNKEFLALSPKIHMIVGADLIVCMLVFVMHITVAEEAGALPQILFSSIILYIAYFVLTFIMIAAIVKEYETNAQIMLKQNSYDNLQEYMSQIEELYQNIRAFRHDYSNIMASMAVYINDNDMEGLKEYYDKQIMPINRLLNKEKDVVARLLNLNIIELKGLISVKINYALEMKIKVDLEIADRIEKINIKNIDLVRIMGILLDNAIEACQECEAPYINLSIIKMDNGAAIIIRNTYRKKAIEYSKLGKPGITTKGARRGMGLYNIKSILKEYDNVTMDTEYTEEFFTQSLEIYEKDQEV